MHALFSGVLPAQRIVPLPVDEAGFDAFEGVLRADRDRIAAVILEPLIQAAGGMKFHSAAILRRIAETCRAHDVLLILDEIATGFGRTGSLFAAEQAGICPDIVTVSKALTGGTLPLAATVAGDRVYDGFLSEDFGHALMHGPTFTGNALGCAAANASLDLFEREPRLAQVAAIEAQLTAELEPCRGLAGVADVRCRGAIGVVQLDRVPDHDRLRRRFLEAGVWVRPFGDIVYLMPPFIIAPEELTTLTAAVCTVVAEWSAEI